jgi:hypothetical protein
LQGESSGTVGLLHQSSTVFAANERVQQLTHRLANGRNRQECLITTRKAGGRSSGASGLEKIIRDEQMAFVSRHIYIILLTDNSATYLEEGISNPKITEIQPCTA